MSERATKLQRNAARRMYEQDGASKAAIAREFNFTPATVSAWAKKDGWQKPGEHPAASVPDEPFTPEPQSVTVVPEPAEVEVEVAAPSGDEAALRARIAELEAENQRLKPTHELGGMFDDRVAWLTDNSPEGEAYWLNRAEAAFKQENQQRAKDGLPVFDIKNHPDILDDHINDLKTKEAMANAAEPTEPASRKVKLFIMRNGMPTLEQIPMESQINNMAGSLADGIVRYTRKGFKLTDPFLCPRAGCFRAAAADAGGNWEFDGYCSDRHRVEVEGSDSGPTVGLQTKDTILSGIR